VSYLFGRSLTGHVSALDIGKQSLCDVEDTKQNNRDIVQKFCKNMWKKMAYKITCCLIMILFVNISSSVNKFR